eukprot:1798333-Lingulodinium_polyedra.AAC.1
MPRRYSEGSGTGKPSRAPPLPESGALYRVTWRLRWRDPFRDWLRGLPATKRWLSDDGSEWRL